MGKSCCFFVAGAAAALVVVVIAAVAVGALLAHRLGGGRDLSGLWQLARRDAAATRGRPRELTLFAGDDNRTRSTWTADARAPRCSTECRCSRGGLIGYGRYCGYHYTGCDGYGPCDATDACCMAHDRCVGREGYTDCGCTIALAKCLICAGAWYDYYSYSYYSSWRCRHADDARTTMLADIAYLLPSCFDRAEAEAMEAAVAASCR